MSSSVDTLIVNAYNNALWWGSRANDKATAGFDGVDASTEKPAKPKPPRSVDGPGSAPTPKTYNDPELDKLTIEFEEFLNNLFPPEDSAYRYAAGWVIATLENGTTSKFSVLSDGGSCPIGGSRTTTGHGTLLPGEWGHAIREIWASAGLNVVSDANNTAGLDAPALAVQRSVTADSIVSHAKAWYFSKYKSDLWNAALKMSIPDKRAQALKATTQYILAKSGLPLMGMAGRLSIERAISDMERAFTAWYSASVDAYKIAVDNAATEVWYNLSVNSKTIDSTMSQASQKIKAAISGANAMADIAMAANSSVNSVVSASTVGFDS